MRFTRQPWNLEMLQKAGLISARKHANVPQRDSVSRGHNKAAASRLRQRDSRLTCSSGTPLADSRLNSLIGIESTDFSPLSILFD